VVGILKLSLPCNAQDSFSKVLLYFTTQFEMSGAQNGPHNRIGLLRRGDCLIQSGMVDFALQAHNRVNKHGFVYAIERQQTLIDAIQWD
jgi:hypothetical protein